MQVATCQARGYMNRSHQAGRYRSGQTGQTVNLLALRLRWFESSPAQIFFSRAWCVRRPQRQRLDRHNRNSAESGFNSKDVKGNVCCLVAASALAAAAFTPPTVSAAAVTSTATAA